MTKTQKKLIQLGFSGCIFGLIILILPNAVLFAMYASIGFVALWVVCMVVAIWIVSLLEDWVESRDD